MRSIAIFLLTYLVWLGAAAADQRDPRLAPLFEKLRESQDPTAAQKAEQAIWTIWLETDSAAVNILMRKGILAMQRRDFRTALRNFDQIVDLAPDYAEGWNKRATVYYLMGAFKESLDDIVKTLDLEPRHFGALSGRGLVLTELERNEEALEAFEDALAVNPAMPSVRLNIEALRKLLEGSRI